MKITMQTTAFATAVSMSAFAGVLATTGLATFLPGATLGGINVVLVMGGLFEIGQLVAFAYCHAHWRTMGAGLRYGLGLLATVVVLLDIVGVSGQLSTSFQGRRAAAEAEGIAATAEITAKVERVQQDLTNVDRQIAQVEEETRAASEAQAKARANKSRIQAAKQMQTEAQTWHAKLDGQRAELADRLTSLKSEQGKVQGQVTSGSGEFAAIQFVAQSTGWSEDAVARLIITVISSLPNLFAVALVMASGHNKKQTPEPVKVPVPVKAKRTRTQRSTAARKGWETRKRKAMGPRPLAAVK